MQLFRLQQYAHWKGSKEEFRKKPKKFDRHLTISKNLNNSEMEILKKITNKTQNIGMKSSF